MHLAQWAGKKKEQSQKDAHELNLEKQNKPEGKSFPSSHFSQWTSEKRRLKGQSDAKGIVGAYGKGQELSTVEGGSGKGLLNSGDLEKNLGKKKEIFLYVGKTEARGRARGSEKRGTRKVEEKIRSRWFWKENSDFTERNHDHAEKSSQKAVEKRADEKNGCLDQPMKRVR